MKNWNYQPPTNNSEHQIDWNQTVVSMFNEIVIENNINNHPVKIFAPIKFKPLFETLLFYNEETQEISDIYLVKFVANVNDDIIVLEGHLLEIINHEF